MSSTGLQCYLRNGREARPWWDHRVPLVDVPLSACEAARVLDTAGMPEDRHAAEAAIAGSSGASREVIDAALTMSQAAECGAR